MKIRPVVMLFHADGNDEANIHFRNFVKLSEIITAHTRNRQPLEVSEWESFTDRYWSCKLHASKIENTLNDKFFVIFPKVAPNINQEVLRCVS
jgi:hypothetical protein